MRIRSILYFWIESVKEKTPAGFLERLFGGRLLPGVRLRLNGYYAQLKCISASFFKIRSVILRHTEITGLDPFAWLFNVISGIGQHHLPDQSRWVRTASQQLLPR